MVNNRAELIDIRNQIQLIDDPENAMALANSILGGHGVEALTDHGAFIDHYWLNTTALYVNLGDTYDETILYDTDNKTFEVVSWGSFVEEYDADHSAYRTCHACQGSFYTDVDAFNIDNNGNYYHVDCFEKSKGTLHEE